MRTGLVLVIVSMLCLLIGIIFSALHWPLAVFFFIINIAIWPIGLLIFLIATLSHPRFQDLMNVRYGPIKARTLVHVLIVLTVLAVIANIGALFKFQHWPLLGPIWWPFTIVAAALVWKFMQHPRSKGSAPNQ